VKEQIHNSKAALFSALKFIPNNNIIITKSAHFWEGNLRGCFFPELTAQAEAKNAHKKELDLGELKVSLNELEISTKNDLLSTLQSNRRKGHSSDGANQGGQPVLKAGPKKSTRKSARTKMVAETKQFGLVLNHPGSRIDPNTKTKKN